MNFITEDEVNIYSENSEDDSNDPHRATIDCYTIHIRLFHLYYYPSCKYKHYSRTTRTCHYCY